MNKKTNIAEDILPVTIDFAEIRGNKLNESWLRMFGSWVKTIMQRMFGMNDVPVTIKGTRQEVESFAHTLDKEKRYLDTYHKYGLDNPRTYRNKSELEGAVKSFEKSTGIRWPFKE